MYQAIPLLSGNLSLESYVESVHVSVGAAKIDRSAANTRSRENRSFGCKRPQLRSGPCIQRVQTVVSVPEVDYSVGLHRSCVHTTVAIVPPLILTSHRIEGMNGAFHTGKKADLP
jgi:hypothetical protein